MEGSPDAKRPMHDITECPICFETFVDPKMLPCIHTFCLRCLRGWGKGKRPGDQVSCPLCRNDFPMPIGGFENLPRNAVVARLLEKIMSHSGKLMINLCDLCCDVKEKQERASMYCTDCQQYLCSCCAGCHRKLRCAKSHKLVTIDSDMQHRDTSENRNGRFCDQHPKEVLEFCCYDCRVPICMLCFMEVHQRHRCSNIEKFSEFDFSMAVAEATPKNLAVKSFDCVEEIRQLEASITKKDEEFESRTDSHTNLLLERLSSLSDDRSKAMETALQELEQQMAMLDNCNPVLPNLF